MTFTFAINVPFQKISFLLTNCGYKCAYLSCLSKYLNYMRHNGTYLVIQKQHVPKSILELSPNT